MVERVFHREDAAPGLADNRMAILNPEVARQRGELVLEELRRPELGGRIRQMLALAAAELVVENTPAVVAGEVGDRLDVVVGRTRAAVADDDGRLPYVEIPHNLVPGLVSVPCKAITCQRERHLRADDGMPQSARRRSRRAAGAPRGRSRSRTGSACGSGSR